MMGMVQGHELLHHLINTVPDMAREYVGIVLDRMADSGGNLSDFIDNKLMRAEKAGRPIDMRAAIEEVIADGSSMMLKDTNALQMMADRNPGLFQKVKEWIASFVKRLREAFSNVGQIYPEARALMTDENGTLRYAEDLQRRFDSILVEEASERMVSREPVAAKQMDADTTTKPAAGKAPEPRDIQTALTREKKKDMTLGRSDVLYVGKDEISFRYAAIRADEATSSFEEGYPMELQPRDTDRVDSARRRASMAKNLVPGRVAASVEATTGAPVLRNDKMVIAGNHRWDAIKAALLANKQAGKGYTEYMKAHAHEYGLEPDDFDGNTLLVRYIDDDVDAKTLAERSNESVTVAYSDTESAVSDAGKISTDMLMIADMDNGDIDTVANNRFVSRFLSEVVPQSEAARLTDSKGRLNKAGEARIRSAMFQMAYGDGYLTEQMSESMDVESRNMIRAMTSVAPRLAMLNAEMESGNLNRVDIGKELAESYRTVMRNKQYGIGVEEFLNQTTMLEEVSPAQRMLLEMFVEYKRSASKMSGAIGSMLDALEEHGDPRQVALFDDAKPTAESVIRQGINDYTRQLQEKAAASERYSLREYSEHEKENWTRIETPSATVKSKKRMAHEERTR